MEKGTVLIYHSHTSILNGNEYTITRISPAGKIHLKGNIYSGNDRQFDFNMGLKDLEDAIQAGIYTIKP